MKMINIIKEKPLAPVTCASNNVNILLDNIHCNRKDSKAI